VSQLEGVDKKTAEYLHPKSELFADFVKIQNLINVHLSKETKQKIPISNSNNINIEEN
jgi:ABC-type Fe3+/spermidine/putrescine transport system ATPase subunit